MAVDWNSYEGHSIGEWRLESFLGDRDDKGFYVARSERSPQPVLIKLMPAADGAAGAVRASWKRAKELSHQNILHIHETGDAELDGTRVTYGVFDLPDDDLGEMLTTHTLPPAQGRTLFSAVAAGLDYLHLRELRHGAVVPTNIFMADGEVRLGVDNISPAGVGGRESDMRQFGATIVRAITGRSDALAKLDSPFNEIAAGCLSGSADQKWTPARVIQVLSGQPAPVAPAIRLPVSAAQPAPATVRPASAPIESTNPATTSVKRERSNWPLAAAAAIPAFLLGYWFLGRSSEPQAAARQTIERPRTIAPSSAPIVENKPDPTQSTAAPVRPAEVTPRKVEPAPRKAAQPAPRAAELKAPKKLELPPRKADSAQPGSWAVIAATYSNYGAAAKRVEKIKAQSPQLDAHVFPAEGEGKRYYVVLGSGLSQEGASRLLGLARQHGAPKDAYVTRVEER